VFQAIILAENVVYMLLQLAEKSAENWGGWEPSDNRYYNRSILPLFVHAFTCSCTD